ncbi:MAG: hypothetical protein QM752_05860 [Gammaproteobacteria bacterium]
MEWDDLAITPLVEFLKHQRIPASQWPVLTALAQTQLPKPYHFLLTQPLMTVGLQQFYQRKPMLRAPLYSVYDESNQQYSRAIVLMIDSCQRRNDALVADQASEAQPIVLGFITMNLSALPVKMVSDVLEAKTPLGALLADSALNLHSQRRYLNLRDRQQVLTASLGATSTRTLYGRTNALSLADGQWVARVVEVLSPHVCRNSLDSFEKTLFNSTL